MPFKDSPEFSAYLLGMGLAIDPEGAAVSRVTPVASMAAPQGFAECVSMLAGRSAKHFALAFRQETRI